MPKKIERGDSLVSPGMVCYVEKQVKPFWSSSLGQIVQFDTIIFCRTFKKYFGQFVWIEKKRVTIIDAFHFMKRRLKRGPFSLVRFCKCSEKFLAKAGTRTRDRWVHRKPIKICTKKRYIHDEVCGLTKKIATVIVGLFSLEKRRLKTAASFSESQKTSSFQHIHSQNV